MCHPLPSSWRLAWHHGALVMYMKDSDRFIRHRFIHMTVTWVWTNARKCNISWFFGGSAYNVDFYYRRSLRIWSWSPKENINRDVIFFTDPSGGAFHSWSLGRWMAAMSCCHHLWPCLIVFSRTWEITSRDFGWKVRKMVQLVIYGVFVDFENASEMMRKEGIRGGYTNE